MQACIHTHVSLYLDATLNIPGVETLQLESSCCKTSPRSNFYRTLSSVLLSASLWRHHSTLLLQLRCKLVFSKQFRVSPETHMEGTGSLTWKERSEGLKQMQLGFFFFFNSCTLLFLKFHLFIFAMLGLHCGPQAFSSCSAWGVTLHRVCGLLTPLLPWALGCVGFRGSPQMKSLSLPAPPNVGLHQIHSIHLNH